MKKTIRFALSIGLVLLTSLARAAPPQTINYQGVLTTGAPAVPVNTPQDITFRLYDAALNGNLLWTDALSTVPVNNGVFNVVLGGSVASPFPPTLVFDRQYFLSVQVSPDAEMSPRQALQMVPYAYRAVVADGVAGSANIAGSQVTGPLSGSTLTALDVRYAPASGTTTNTVSVIDTGGNSYTKPSIVVPSDGLPVIIFPSWFSGILKVAKCGNAACTTGTTSIVETISGSVASIAVGGDGLPTISYYDSVNQDLKVVKCGNASCSAGNTITVVDSVGDVGSYSAIAMGADGLPVISYSDVTTKNIKVLKCGNAACSSGYVANIVESYGNNTGASSIAVGPDGLPAIAYVSETTVTTPYTHSVYYVKVAKCSNAACSNVTTSNLGSSSAMNPSLAVIEIGSDGLPLVLYGGTGDVIVIAKCGNDTCSAGNLVTPLSPARYRFYNRPAIAVGTDGLPVVLIGDGGNAVQFTKCGNASCNTGNKINLVNETIGMVYAALAIGVSGLPVIVFTGGGSDFSNLLSVVTCANAGCASQNLARW